MNKNINALGVTSSLCLLLSYLFSAETASQDEAFRSFLNVTMLNYNSWAKANGLDPAPTIKYYVSVSSPYPRIKISGKLTNHVISDHSKISSISRIDSDLARATFSIGEFESHFAAEGDYDVEGTINDTYPVVGNGRYEISNANARMYLFLAFHRFQITEDDHVDLSKADMSWSQIRIPEIEPTFSNLNASGFERDVTEIIKQNYYDTAYDEEFLPTYKYIKQYLQAVFNETTFSEIVESR